MAGINFGSSIKVDFCWKPIFSNYNLFLVCLEILFDGAEDFIFQMNSEILKCTINFTKKNQIALVALFIFPIFFLFFCL